jgi:hypothetical protein
MSACEVEARGTYTAGRYVRTSLVGTGRGSTDPDDPSQLCLFRGFHRIPCLAAKSFDYGLVRRVVSLLVVRCGRLRYACHTAGIA